MHLIYVTLLALMPLKAMDYNESNEHTLPNPLIRLNPAKGITVWLAPEETETITWRSYGKLLGKEAKVPIDRLEITLSPYTWHTDFLRVTNPLVSYNRSKLAPEYHKIRPFTLPAHLTQPVATLNVKAVIKGM